MKSRVAAFFKKRSRRIGNKLKEIRNNFSRPLRSIVLKKAATRLFILFFQTLTQAFYTGCWAKYLIIDWNGNFAKPLCGFVFLKKPLRGFSFQIFQTLTQVFHTGCRAQCCFIIRIPLTKFSFNRACLLSDGTCCGKQFPSYQPLALSTLVRSLPSHTCGYLFPPSHKLAAK